MKNTPNTKKRVIESLKDTDEWKDYIFLFDEGGFFWAYKHDAFVLAYLFWFALGNKEGMPSTWISRKNFESRFEELRMNWYSYAIRSREDKAWRYHTLNDGTKDLNICFWIETINEAISKLKTTIWNFQENHKENTALTLEDFFELYNEIKEPFQSIIDKWNIKDWVVEKSKPDWEFNFKSSVINRTKSPDIDIVGRIKEINEVKQGQQIISQEQLEPANDEPDIIEQLKKEWDRIEQEDTEEIGRDDPNYLPF